MSTTPVSFRFSAEVKELLEKAAAQQHRSQTNFLELLIISHCQKNDIRADGVKKAKAESTPSQNNH